MRGRLLPPPIPTLLIAVGYYAIARLSLNLALVEGVVAPVWAPTGLAVVSLMTFGGRIWPGIAIGAFLVNLPIVPTPLAALGIAAGNTLAPLLALRLLKITGFRRELDRLRDVLTLIGLGGLVAMMVSATFGTGALLASAVIAYEEFVQTWLVWWVGDATGVFLLVPLLLSLRRKRPRLSSRRWVEAVILFGAVVGVSVLITSAQVRLLFLAFPFLIWAALRFGPGGASLAALVVSSSATWAAVRSTGPFIGTSLTEKMVTLQLFNASAVLTALVLGVLTVERNRAREALERATLELERRVQERSRQLSASNERLEGEVAQHMVSERLLSERTHQLEEAQTLAHIGSWRWEIASNAVTWSDEMYRIFGLEPQSVSLSLEGYLELIHPEDQEELKQVIGNAQRTGEPFVFEHRVIRPDSSIAWIHSQAKVVNGEQGAVAMVGTAQDVTERKAAEKMARAQAELSRMKDLFMRAPSLIVVTSGPDHVIEFANDAVYDLVGMQDLTGGRIDNAFGSPDNARIIEICDHVYATGESYSESSALIPTDRLGTSELDDAYFNIAFQPIRGEDGTIQGVISHAVDVTATVLARQAMETLLERERRIAETLQRNLLPDRFPDFPGVALAGRYMPGAAGLEVGGDWYDVFPLPGGGLGVSIGDVVGRGLGAAAAMGQLRTALRAYALEGNSPGQLIELLNRLVLGLKGGQTATVLYATFDPRAQTLSFAAAGHPPPLLVSADGPARYLEGGRSSALGLPGIAVEEDLVSLERGSTLVLYTDGLVERRGRSIEEGMALLSRVAEEHRGDLESLCDHVMSDSIGLGAPEDDVALLALRPLPISSEPLHLRLRAEPEVLITLRRALRQWLLDLGGEPEEVGEIVLACNEAASNVLEHAYGQEEGILEVGAVCDERNVHITVRDFGQWRVSRGIEHGRGLQLMHSLVDSVEVVRGPTGTEVQLRRRLGPGEAPHQPVAPEASLMAGLEDPGVELVELEREIDLSNVGEMADLLGRAVDNHPLGLVVDLSRTTYLDSAGIRLLFQVAARLERHRQQLRVVVPEGSPIRRVLALTRFESCAPIDPSVEAAMAGIRSAFDTRTQGT